MLACDTGRTGSTSGSREIERRVLRGLKYFALRASALSRLAGLFADKVLGAAFFDCRGGINVYILVMIIIIGKKHMV